MRSLAVTTATNTRKPAWQAQVTERKRSIVEEFVDVSHPGGGWIRFRVNRRKGRPLTFTDYRERRTGTAGTTGIWGTLPPQPAGYARFLTPTAFRLELAELVGPERADEIVESLTE